MFYPGHRSNWVLKGAGILLAAAVMVAVIPWILAARVPGTHRVRSALDLRGPAPGSVGSESGGVPDWSVFEATAAPQDPGGRLSARFRLAGTFFEFEADRDDERRAVLHELATGRQWIVSEGDRFDNVSVVRIVRDGIVLEEDGREEELWLSFSAGGGPGAGGIAGRGGASFDFDSGSRFGKRVGEDSWVFSRDALLDYYAELMDAPDRLVDVFDSLKPLYDDNRLITGYVLDVEGEGAFFSDVGLQEGDVVRKVNSLRMTNRRRAEYFIREFVEDRANAFVLDIEREGVPQKLIYQVR